MTRKYELLALADRVDRLEDRPLSREELLAIFRLARPRSEFVTGRDCDDARHLFVDWWERGASESAAMTLVPEGYDHIEVHPPRGEYVNWTVHIIPKGRGIINTSTGYAASYAMALAAAALRSIASQEPNT